MGSNDLRSEFRKELRAVPAGEAGRRCFGSPLIAGEELRNWLWGAASCAMGSNDLRSEFRKELRAVFAGEAGRSCFGSPLLAGEELRNG